MWNAQEVQEFKDWTFLFFFRHALFAWKIIKLRFYIAICNEFIILIYSWILIPMQQYIERFSGAKENKIHANELIRHKFATRHIKSTLQSPPKKNIWCVCVCFCYFIYRLANAMEKKYTYCIFIIALIKYSIFFFSQIWMRWKRWRKTVKKGLKRVEERKRHII